VTEVGAGIYRIEGLLGDRSLCCYLLTGSETLLLVDSGIDTTPQDWVMPAIGRLGRDPAELRFVLNTHCDVDHMGGNASLHELLPNAVLMCHELDRPMTENVELTVAKRYEEFATAHAIEDPPEIQQWYRAIARPAPINFSLRGGEIVRLADKWHVTILHTPGHSPGHLTVYDPRSHAAIITDAVLGKAMYTHNGIPNSAPAYRHVDTYVSSIRQLQGLEIDTLLTGHFPIYHRKAATEFLNESLEFVEGLDEAVQVGLSKATAPITTRELVDQVGDQLRIWPMNVNTSVTNAMVGHLERLVAAGKVKVGKRDQLVTWQWR